MSSSNDQGQAGLRIPFDQAGRDLWQQRLGQMAILHHLGTELDLSHESLVRLHLKHPGIQHQGGLGTEALNGAIIAGMMDCAISVAGIVHFRGKTCGTVQMSIQFMKPVRSMTCSVECYAVRKSPNLVFLEARLIERGNRCSVMATGVVGLAKLGPSEAETPAQQHHNWLAPSGHTQAPGAQA